MNSNGGVLQNINKLFGANPDINVMFLDEAHFGMSTEKAQKIVDVLNSKVENTVKIYPNTSNHTRNIFSQAEFDEALKNYVRVNGIPKTNLAVQPKSLDSGSKVLSFIQSNIFYTFVYF